MIAKIVLPLSCAFLIFILEGIALFTGVDGKCMALSTAVIGGLGGYGIREIAQIIKSKMR